MWRAGPRDGCPRRLEQVVRELAGEETQDMMDEYLNNMLLENCVENPAVSASVRREPGCDLRATDFDCRAITASGRGRRFAAVRRAPACGS